MAKRRNSPALFELLRDQSGTSPEAVSRDTPGATGLAEAPAASGTASVTSGAAVAPAPIEAPTAEPSREPAPLSDRPAIEITSPRFVAEPVRVAQHEPAMPDLSDLEPEPVVSRGSDGRISFALTPGMVAAASGGVVVVLVIAITIAYSLGGAASKEELQPILGEQANVALQGADDSLVVEPVVREPVTERRERNAIPETTLALTPEQGDSTPAVADPITDDSDSQAEEASVQAGGEQAKPSEPANIDTRQSGLNYMYTSVTFDREEAVRAQQFLFDNGIDSLIEEGTRRSDGRTVYRLWTLLGIPGAGFQQSREKFEHERAIFDLGNEWLTERGGRLDFSRPGQIGWDKYGE